MADIVCIRNVCFTDRAAVWLLDWIARCAALGGINSGNDCRRAATYLVSVLKYLRRFPAEAQAPSLCCHKPPACICIEHESQANRRRIVERFHAACGNCMVNEVTGEDREKNKRRRAGRSAA